MHRSKTVLLIIALVILGAPPVSQGTALSQVSITNDDEFTRVVSLLWSPDPSTRGAAKEKLIQLGKTSVGRLTDLLRNLTEAQEPQFETGREDEGKKFLEHHYRQPSDASEIEKVLSVEISWRIKQDIVDVLRRLEAREAVPVLIEGLDSGIQAGSATHERKSPEMEMLVQFGSIAVPDLDQAIENAEATVANEPDNPGRTVEENQLSKIGRTQSRQARLAMIIGEIGDERSLPVLERLVAQLQQRGDRAYAIRYIEKAIAEIKEKNK